MNGVLVVFAKEPAPGQVKTRLCPPLSPGQAAELYGCMLDDVLASSARAAVEHGLAPVLAVDPPDALERLAARAPTRFRVVAQRGPDLGARMEHAVATWAAAGASPILLRGSDSPALAAALIGAAVAALDRADVALSPSPDGGYNLVAIRRRHAGLFHHEMSTERVGTDTFERAEALGLRVEHLAESVDVDHVDDLARLAKEGFGQCPRTERWLDNNRLLLATFAGNPLRA